MVQAFFKVETSVKESGVNSRGWDVDSDLNGALTLEDLFKYTKDALITISSDALKEEQAKGFDKKPVLLVDGKVGKRPDEVNPLGKIEYVARQDAKKIIRVIYEEILKRSPVDTGEYKRSNVVTFNGAQIANDRESLEKWLESVENFDNRDRIRFVNTAPYARKLERLGVTAQRTRSKVVKKDKRRDTFFRNTTQVPNGAYSLAYRSIKARYKANSFIAFDLLPGNLLGLTGSYDGRRRNFVKDGRPYLYPTILLYVVRAGLTDSGELIQ